jgi:hypothetical protein
VVSQWAFAAVLIDARYQGPRSDRLIFPGLLVGVSECQLDLGRDAATGGNAVALLSRPPPDLFDFPAPPHRDVGCCPSLKMQMIASL